MAKIFICYRREETSPHAGRLYDRLISHFGDNNIFMDIDRIEPGADFYEVIEREVGSCDAFLGIIGKRWASGTKGRRRLDKENDFVRLEMQTALNRNIRVIPCLVEGAKMPTADTLPEAIGKLARLQAVHISNENFHTDVDRLVKALQKMFKPESENLNESTSSNQTVGDITRVVRGYFPENLPLNSRGQNQTKPNTSSFPKTNQKTDFKNFFSKKYEIIKEIASGGMGTIYLATDIRLGREVAIKRLHSQYSGDQAFAQRFLREAWAMAKLDHPNIIRIWSVEEEESSHCIVMEFSHGQDLKQILRSRGSLPIAETLLIIIQIIQGLAYAHYMGIIHRDIKPSNILVDQNGKVKITDFGIAAAFSESSLTIDGTVMGTPEYMAPEQARAEIVDPSTDLYSVGILMYEILTGQTPYKGIPAQSLVAKLAFGSENPSFNFPAHIPVELQDLIIKMTQKRVEDRLKDTEEILTILKKNASLSHELQPDTDQTVVQVPSYPTQTLPKITSNDSPKQSQSEKVFRNSLEEKISSPPQPPNLIIIAIGILVILVIAGWYFLNSS